MKNKIKIQAVEGRIPGFPESGNPIPHNKVFEVTPTPQIKRMLKDGDIEEVDKKESPKKEPLKKKQQPGGKE